MKTKLIVALDVDSSKRAKEIVKILYPKVKIFKVGLQLFTAQGPLVVNWLVKKGIKVFLDLKLFDIPHTMVETAKLICKMNIFMFTVHIQAGKDALIKLKKIVFQEAKKLKIKRPLIFGVTLLTSQRKNGTSKLIRLVKVAKEVGLDGIVISVKDLDFLPLKLRKNLLIVSPGIRMEKIEADDQKRTATPKEARDKGIDYIVVGRPILEAKDPLKKLKCILRELR
ncbi:MAG: orotidine-5'-phosphate decarboxylase [Candidatus Omnitrophica bacterium]|nr:orotidine-5'-phosphate decarboxylase [Candidatus Omnitrophota bacterium]